MSANHAKRAYKRILEIPYNLYSSPPTDKSRGAQTITEGIQPSIPKQRYIRCFFNAI